MGNWKRNGLFGFRQLSVGWMAAGAISFWAAGIGGARAQSLTPTATPALEPAPASVPVPLPAPTPALSSESASPTGEAFAVDIVPSNSLPPNSLSAAQFTEIPTPTWWPRRTDCPTPPPSPTPFCLLPFKGPFYRTDQPPLTVEVGQPFRVEIESYHQNWCGYTYLDSEIVCSTETLRLAGFSPQWDLYYDGPISLDFEAIGAGTAQIRARYETTPPVFFELVDVLVYSTSPTLTYTPIPSPSPTPSPTEWPTPSPECTPAVKGPFYDCSSPWHRGQVGKIIVVTLTVERFSGGCYIQDTYPVFSFDSSIVRLVGSTSLMSCIPEEEELYFQGLRSGITLLEVRYDSSLGSRPELLTGLEVVPTPAPVGWMLR